MANDGHQREVCMLIGEDDVVLWSDASESPVALPDSRARWEAIWSRRERIVEVAHSHPLGPEAFSREDETTMAALVSALGRSLVFSVISPRGMVRCTIDLAERGEEERSEDFVVSSVESEPWWASLLRLASGMNHQGNADVEMPRTLKTPKTNPSKTPQEE